MDVTWQVGHLYLGWAGLSPSCKIHVVQENNEWNVISVANGLKNLTCYLVSEIYIYIRMLNSIISGRMSQSGFSSELSLCYIAHCETFHRLHECAMDRRSMCRFIGESIDQSTDGSLYSEHRLCLVISVFEYGGCRVCFHVVCHVMWVPRYAWLTFQAFPRWVVLCW